MIPQLASDVNEEYEFGVHYQTKLYDTGQSVITAGVPDLLLSDDLINILFYTPLYY